jgi:uncharacterized protein (DUF1778 family)
VKLDLKSVLGAGPEILDATRCAPEDTTEQPAPRPPSEPPRPRVPKAAAAVRPAPSPPLPPAPLRSRVAVSVPGDLLDAVRLHAEASEQYVTDVVLEAITRHGPNAVARAQARLATRARPARRATRQRNVRHPTLIVLYLSDDERQEVDDACASANLTRSAFVAEVLAEFTQAVPPRPLQG